MVFRLFVPSCEGQHQLVPKRPEPLGANATLQYSVLGSTAAAAAYTSFATRYSHRVNSGYNLSKPALFVRSSAKLGLWAGLLSAAAHSYYSSQFTSVLLSQQQQEGAPWKLWEKAKSFTVDDGCLIGAGLGLAASAPALFMRRLAIPRWTRCAGLANIGACAGVLGGHGYLQYTGERQKAYLRLDRQLEQRSVAFWILCLDKQAMSRFNPLVQLYVRHNALWYAQQLPDSALSQADGYDAGLKEPQYTDAYIPSTEPTFVHDESFYVPPFDYLEDLKLFSAETTSEKIKEYEVDLAALLREADFIMYFAARRQYEYCHLGDVEEEERRQRLEELQLLQITHRKLRAAAEQLESRLIVWRIALQHKAIMDSSSPANVPLSAWLPPSRHDFSTHDPALSIWELAHTQEALDQDINIFERVVANPDCTRQMRERWKMDLEDGRSLLRVADRIVWEFEKMQGAARMKKGLEQSGPARQAQAQEQGQEQGQELKQEQKQKQKHIAEHGGAGSGSAAVGKPPNGSLEVGKS